MATPDDAAVYYFAPEGEARQGPVSLVTLRELLVGGSLDGFTLLWTPGMPTWQALADLDELRARIRGIHAPPAARVDDADAGEASPSNAAAPFFYADAESGTRAGPVAVGGLTSLALAGYVDADTLVWRAGMQGWAPARTIPELAVPLSRGAAAAEIAGHVDGEAGIGGGNASETTATTRDDIIFSVEDAEAELQALLGDAAPATRADAAAGSSRAAAGKRARPTVAHDENGDGPALAGVDKQVPGGIQTKRKRKKRGAKAAAAAPNPWIYIKGVPNDASTEELVAHFKRAGIIKLDYAYLCYLREEAVELAIQLLDGADLRPGVALSVEQANADSIPTDAGSARAGAQHRRLTPEEVTAKIRAVEQQAALSWAEEGDESLGLRIIILKHAFTLSEMSTEDDAHDLRDDLATELGKVGTVDKLHLYPPLAGVATPTPASDPEGIVMVKFRSAGAAAACISLFNGRWFSGRKLQCEYWDGITDYAGKTRRAHGAEEDGDNSDGNEEDREEQRRLDAFGAWLEDDDE